MTPRCFGLPSHLRPLITSPALIPAPLGCRNACFGEVTFQLQSSWNRQPVARLDTPFARPAAASTTKRGHSDFCPLSPRRHWCRGAGRLRHCSAGMARMAHPIHGRRHIVGASDLGRPSGLPPHPAGWIAWPGTVDCTWHRRWRLPLCMYEVWREGRSRGRVQAHGRRSPRTAGRGTSSRPLPPLHGRVLLSVDDYNRTRRLTAPTSRSRWAEGGRRLWSIGLLADHRPLIGILWFGCSSSGAVEYVSAWTPRTLGISPGYSRSFSVAREQPTSKHMRVSQVQTH